MLRINFVGSFTTGYVGETADEVHLVRELRKLGHIVQEVPRDIWKAIVDGEWDDNWKDRQPLQNAHINIICKWHHFNNESYIEKLRTISNAPVFYWTWDFMDYDVGGFHYNMSLAADLLLTNDGFDRIPKEIKWHYFPFDVTDGNIEQQHEQKRYKVVFFGTKLDQGDRVEWLTYLNNKIPVTVFSWNWEEWKKLGFDAHPAVYGDEFAKTVSQSKVILGFNVNDHTWGYWSNRTGKILALGGFLLQRYVPGMELFLRDGAEYFSSKEEMVEKVTYFTEMETLRDLERVKKEWRALEIGRQRFTSEQRVKDLEIVIQRFLKGGI